MTERKDKWPEGVSNNLVGEVGRDKVDSGLGVTVRKSVEWYCRNPIVQLNHQTGTDIGHHRRGDGRFMIKKHGQIKAIEIPYWGKASEIVRIYNEG